MKFFFNSFIFIGFFLGCSEPKEKLSFDEWYAKNQEVKSGEFDSAFIREKEIESTQFQLDTIYHSMYGPQDFKQVTLGETGDVVWLTGYSVKERPGNSNSEYTNLVCHNCLNSTDYKNFPWQMPVESDRIFTLSQGYTQLTLPKGFGIPIPGDEVCHVWFQALNLNDPNLDTNISHKVNIQYVLDAEIDFPMKPLKKMEVGIQRQYAGPDGLYNEPVDSSASLINNTAALYDFEIQNPKCGIEMKAGPKGDSQFEDDYGRKYIAHWKVPPGDEIIRSNITSMLNLKEDVRLHMAVPHVHAYSEYLELFDLTLNQTVFKCKMEPFADRHGLAKIENFISEEGVMLFKEHSYEIISSYKNTSQDTLSAMATVVLYVAL